MARVKRTFIEGEEVREGNVINTSQSFLGDKGEWVDPDEAVQFSPMTASSVCESYKKNAEALSALDSVVEVKYFVVA